MSVERKWTRFDRLLMWEEAETMVQLILYVASEHVTYPTLYGATESVWLHNATPWFINILQLLLMATVAAYLLMSELRAAGECVWHFTPAKAKIRSQSKQSFYTANTCMSPDETNTQFVADFHLHRCSIRFQNVSVCTVDQESLQEYDYVWE